MKKTKTKAKSKRAPKPITVADPIGALHAAEYGVLKAMQTIGSMAVIGCFPTEDLTERCAEAVDKWSAAVDAVLDSKDGSDPIAFVRQVLNKVRPA